MQERFKAVRKAHSQSQMLNSALISAGADAAGCLVLLASKHPLEGNTLFGSRMDGSLSHATPLEADATGRGGQPRAGAIRCIRRIRNTGDPFKISTPNLTHHQAIDAASVAQPRMLMKKRSGTGSAMACGISQTTPMEPASRKFPGCSSSPARQAENRRSFT